MDVMKRYQIIQTSAEEGSMGKKQEGLTIANCYISATLGPAKMLRYSVNMCYLEAGPAAFSIVFGFRCPQARGDEVSMATEPRAQSYSQRQGSWGIGSSPSVSRCHVGPAAACTDGPATHRLRIPDPTQQGVFTTCLKG